VIIAAVIIAAVIMAVVIVVVVAMIVLFHSLYLTSTEPGTSGTAQQLRNRGVAAETSA